jgi:NHLM bacteriocin system ABC transporter ATP-binding protein
VSSSEPGPELFGPIRVDGRYAAYLVRGGPVHMFASRGNQAGVPAKRNFVAEFPVGALIPAAGPDRQVRLELVPLPGSHLVGVAGPTLHRWLTPEEDTGARTEPAAVSDPGPGPEVAGWIDAALRSAADSTRTGQPPRGVVPMLSRQVVSLAAGQAVTGNSHVWWVRAVGGSVTRNGGGPGQTATGLDLSLLAGRDWLVADTDCTVENLSTADLLAAGELSAALRHHMDQLLAIVAAGMEASGTTFMLGLQERKRANAAAVAQATRGMLGVVGAHVARRTKAGPQNGARYRDAVAVLEVLASRSGHTITEPADQRNHPTTAEEALRAVARSSSLHLRDTKLPEGWWRRDLGPLVGWRTVEGRAWPHAVPLLFRGGRYREIDPVTRAERPVDRAAAAAFGPTATQVQEPLPVAADLRTALRLGLAGTATDGRSMLVAAAFAAVLGLATPVATGKMLASIESNGSLHGLEQFPLILVGAATVAAMMSILQNLRLLRLQGRAESGTQLILWDRLLRLPVAYFRSWSSGELASAVLGISMISESVGGVMAQALASVLTVLADLVLIFILSVPLGLCTLGIVILAAGAVAGLGRAAIRRGRGALPDEYRTAAFTNQMLAGMAKVKLAGAEDRVYGRWSALQAVTRARLSRLRQVQAVTIALSTVLPIGGQLVLFALLAGPLAGQIGLDKFLVVNVAFTILLGGLLMLATASVEIFAAIPRLEVLAPVVSARPERLPDRVDPGDLRGDVTLTAVTFGYRAEDPPVLEDVSLRVYPGQFVAIVGPSGSGKSTLLRLLLGFEQPRSGAVLYDDQDLGGLDVQAVRRQCGVVLQDGQLFAGSIRENICGAGNFTLEQVWSAARLAGIDGEIEALPMGMSTMVPFGGGTLSAGQRQRVLIARALIRRPRLVFFDEATSALDNRTQEIVTASTRELAATRIVIAHRLSTIVAADRIVVMDSGRVVQEGSYLELMRERDGLFYRLAARQLLTGPDQADGDDEAGAPASMRNGHRQSADR